jgi:hypothetical protein
MKTAFWISIVGLCFVLVVPDANALPGRTRRTRRRTAIILGSDSDSQTEQAEQEPAAAEEEPVEADATEAATSQPTATDGVLPTGTVVETLPEGCTKTVVGNVEYSYDGKNYFRAAFQGNELVYVTGQP